MDWIVSKKKYDFIGKRSLYRSDTIKEGRKQMVGLLTKNPNEVLEEGAQIVAEIKKKPPMKMLGHVTSSYFSPNLKKSIALAVIKNGKNLKGKKLYVPMKKKIIEVTVSDTTFLDKEGSKLNAWDKLPTKQTFIELLEFTFKASQKFLALFNSISDIFSFCEVKQFFEVKH